MDTAIRAFEGQTSDRGADGEIQIFRLRGDGVNNKSFYIK